MANQSGMVCLVFGAPQFGRDRTSGAYCYNAGYKNTGQIQQAVRDFINGYNSNSAHTQNIRICVSTTNNVASTSLSYAPTSVDNYKEHGRLWANMVNGIATSGKVIGVYAGNDMELDWNSPANTRAWVDGYAENAGSRYLYNLGDNAGTHSGSTGGYTHNRNNGWTTNDVLYISLVKSICYPTPQIYYTTMANQWYNASLYYYNQYGSKFIFSGLLSQDRAAGNDLYADQSYNALKTELAKSTNTSQSSFSYPTIMKWQP